MLWLIGIGLAQPEDVTLRGLEAIRNCDRVFIDAYTSILCSAYLQQQQQQDEQQQQQEPNHQQQQQHQLQQLEQLYGKKVELADRDIVEQGEQILDAAANGSAALLVVGDPFGATTHTDLALRCIQRKIQYRVVHNASIITAVGACGLQLYAYGETVSIPFWDAVSRPTSFMHKWLANRSRGLHTLCLLDIKVKEQSVENLLRGRKVYEPARFMSCAVAAQQLSELLQENEDLPQPAACLAIGLARVGCSSERISATSLTTMASIELGPPLHSLVLPAALHPVEAEFLQQFVCDPSDLQLIADCTTE